MAVNSAEIKQSFSGFGDADLAPVAGSKESSKRVERNAIENLNGSVAAYTHNVKRWRGGRIMLRWVGAALLEARKEFRRVKGFRAMPKLVKALEQHEVDQGLHDNAKAA